MKEKFKEFEKNKKDDFKVGKTITDNDFIIKSKDDAQNKVDGKEVNNNKSQIKSSKQKSRCKERDRLFIKQILGSLGFLDFGFLVIC